MGPIVFLAIAFGILILGGLLGRYVSHDDGHDQDQGAVNTNLEGFI